MKRQGTSEVVDVIVYFTRNLLIICSAGVCLAVGIAYLHHVTSGALIFPTIVTVLGMTGIALMILGGLSLASAPGKTVARGTVSRTYVKELKILRPGPNPLFGVGLSVFVSGAILSTIAAALL
jgi:hypothetical protein